TRIKSPTRGAEWSGLNTSDPAGPPEPYGLSASNNPTASGSRHSYVVGAASTRALMLGEALSCGMDSRCASQSKAFRPPVPDGSLALGRWKVGLDTSCSPGAV